MFEYTLDNKRYHTLNYHLKKRFGERVFKAVIDGGFSCPNIDGTAGVGGCSYCKDGSGEFTCRGTITEQLERERIRIENKWGKAGIIAYFQSHTNTYAPLSELREKYEEALGFPNVVGLSIATRPDSIKEEVFDYLEEINKRVYLTLELGLQTVNDATAVRINRGYDFDCFVKTFNELKRRNIRVVVHIINGLTCETREDMLKTARVLSKMEPDGVKIHLLHILKGTVCEREFYEGRLVPLTREEYIDITVNQIRYFKPECVIERITGDGKKDSMVAPLWSLDKISVLGGIDKHFAILDAYQGDLYDKD